MKIIEVDDAVGFARQLESNAFGESGLLVIRLGLRILFFLHDSYDYGIGKGAVFRWVGINHLVNAPATAYDDFEIIANAENSYLETEIYIVKNEEIQFYGLDDFVRIGGTPIPSGYDNYFGNKSAEDIKRELCDKTLLYAKKYVDSPDKMEEWGNYRNNIKFVIRPSDVLSYIVHSFDEQETHNIAFRRIIDAMKCS